jgi:hypothetical protein
LRINAREDVERHAHGARCLDVVSDLLAFALFREQRARILRLCDEACADEIGTAERRADRR